MKNILLVEPSYKNKYPPLGLMKISSYHKNKGDKVVFVKGLSKEIAENVWDRVYITTLFTFYFDITVKTIRFYKKCVQNIKHIYAGGILASLMSEELKEETGIENIITGLLDNSAKIGYTDNVNIDCLTPDYDILEDIDYKYPAGDNYFAYTTRGCPNKCSFCSVSRLEPEFKTTNHIYEHIMDINKKYGAKRNLLLLDNNILNSPDLKEIIKDIKKAGFIHKPNFIDPLKYDIIFQRIKNNHYSEKDISKLVYILEEFKAKIKSKDILRIFETSLKEIKQSENKINKILDTYSVFIPIFNKYRSKNLKKRFVDFNQGIDARLLTDEKMKILSKIPINPLRIAFDDINRAELYKKAVRIANKYGVKEISNYMLYNYNDKPEDLWHRLKINAELREELGVNIFSFPMKYSPVNKTNREFYGTYWNKKYLRAIQCVLLVKKGIVSTVKGFFEKAFGKTSEEYFELLMMPEDFIIYRSFFEKNGLTEKWKNLYSSLTEEEKNLLLEAIKYNKVITEGLTIDNEKIHNILPYYQMKYDKIKYGSGKIDNQICFNF